MELPSFNARVSQAAERALDKPLDELCMDILICAYRVNAITLEDFEVFFMDFHKATTPDQGKAAGQRWLGKVLHKLLAMEE